MKEFWLCFVPSLVAVDAIGVLLLVIALIKGRNITTRRRLATLVLLGAAGWAQIGTAAEQPVPGGIRYLQDFSGLGRLCFFANKQDELQEERYVSEGEMELDFSLVSFGPRWSLRSRFMMLVDSGSSVAENLPFSPKENTYAIQPFLEWQQSPWLGRAGWDHGCQHLIYKDVPDPWYEVEGSNVPPDVYYNRVFVGAGRREIRPEVMRAEYFGATSTPPRVIWYGEAGGYVRSLPGFDEESLYGSNDWRADLRVDLRLFLCGGQHWLLFANSRTQLLLDTAEEIYARQQLQLEVAFDSKGFGSSIYAGWHVVDEHPRDIKEGLVELGAMFYF